MGRALSAALFVLLLLPAAQASSPAPERVLVSFHGLVPDALPGARVLERYDFAGVALVEGVPARLLQVPGVAGVYPDEVLTLELDRVRQTIRADAPAGDASWPTGAGVTVALVDSGVDASHPGFAGRIAAAVKISKSGAMGEGGSDVDGHGTHVAGILAGSGAKSRDAHLRGVAPQAKLVSVDISDSFTTTSAVRAFEWIHDHREPYQIRVVSNSWGREKSDAHYDPDDPVIRASDALVADGLVVVFSAGNRGKDGASTITTEGTNPNVLTVGAAAPGGQAESYSSRGPARDAGGKLLDWIKPDLVAPGTGVVSTRTSSLAPKGASDEERYYVTMNGTSMAAPQVAAAAAMVIQARPTLPPSVVAAILQQTARDMGARGPDSETGFGMLDVRAAIDAARGLDGGSREIPVESRHPIHEEGSLAAAQGLVLASSGVPNLPPTESVAVPILLPAGAASVELWFNWSGPGSFRVSLDGPGSSFAFDGANGAMHLARPVGAGSYQVTIHPTGPVDQTSYAVDGSVLVLASRLVDAPAEFHASHRGAPTNGGFFVPESAAQRFLDDLATKPMIVIGALLACGLGATGAALRRRP